MKAPKFTPGPWTADTDRDSEGNFRASIMDAGLRLEIALVTQDLDHSRDDGEIVARIKRPAAEANARLIAAAPEMFAALRILTAFAATHTGNGATSEEGRTLDAYGDDVAYAVAQARAALAKAVRA